MSALHGEICYVASMLITVTSFSQLRLLDGGRGFDELLMTACGFEHSSLMESPNKVSQILQSERMHF